MMNVRKITPTSISLIVLILGLYFLVPILLHSLPHSTSGELYSKLNTLRYAVNKMGGYHETIVYIALWIILVVGIVDTILNKYVGFNLRHSFGVHLILSAVAFTFMFIPVNQYQLGTGIYIIAILGIHLTFSMFTKSIGLRGNSFMRFIKVIRQETRIKSMQMIDRFVIYGMSLLLSGFFVLSAISLTTYMINNWSMISR